MYERRGEAGMMELEGRDSMGLFDSIPYLRLGPTFVLMSGFPSGIIRDPRTKVITVQAPSPMASDVTELTCECQPGSLAVHLHH